MQANFKEITIVVGEKRIIVKPGKRNTLSLRVIGDVSIMGQQGGEVIVIP